PLEMVQMHSTGKGKSTTGSQVADSIALDAAVDQLPPGSRAVFLLFSVEGYKHEEIASLFGCSVGNSKSQLHKARKKLKQLLEQRKTIETAADVELNHSLRTPISRIGSMP
ncbi:MAG TPA: RNA polymerase sigma factor, partial [Pyrinomonadaceae bacterium]|nr:RNA polymerase sigma factor [Pyrinomonadaceae bacterium]